MQIQEKYPHLTDKDLQYLNKKLRKLTLWYSQRRKAFKEALINEPERIPKHYKGKARNFYECAICKNAFRQKQVEVDHIDGVEMSKCKNFEEYLSKMFPPSDRLQILCVSCHSDKDTEKELMAVSDG